MVKNASDQSHLKLQIMIDHQLNTSHKKITEIVKATTSNKVKKNYNQINIFFLI